VLSLGVGGYVAKKRHDASSSRTETVGQDTVWVLRDPDKVERSQRQIESQAAELTRSLDTYLSERAPALLGMKLLTILALKSAHEMAITGISADSADSIRQSVSDLLDGTAELSVRADQSVTLCLTENHAAGYFLDVFDETSDESRESGAQGDLGLNVLGIDTSISDGRAQASSSSSSTRTRSESNRLAYQTRDCKSEIRSQKLTPGQTAYAVDFSQVERILQDWSGILENDLQLLALAGPGPAIPSYGNPYLTLHPSTRHDK
jgi:hypothetical protein